MSFSWRLILAPPEMLDYVAAHEAAHLVHLDHSPAFWRTLAGLGVDARAAERWFDRHGQDLHAWGVASQTGIDQTRSRSSAASGSGASS